MFKKEDPVSHLQLQKPIKTALRIPLNILVTHHYLPYYNTPSQPNLMADPKTQLLKEYLRNFTTLRGIIISDSDSTRVVPLYYAFSQPETQQKYKLMATMLNTLAYQNAENLRKLVPHQKTNSIIMTFEGLTFHIQNWKQLVITIFATECTSMPLVKQITDELQSIFTKLDDFAHQYAQSKTGKK